MPLESVDRIRDQLLQKSEDSNLYAILDGASVPDLLPMLNTPNLSAVCLLRGEIDPELAQVAPYLLCLDQQLDLIDWLLTDGWGKHWGIYLITKADFRAVRQHARSVLQVYGPESEPLFFRFYDPRVLRTFLPTCNRGELASVFGPVQRYCMEAKGGDSLIEYKLVNGSLVCR